jgi:hypothetical protein
MADRGSQFNLFRVFKTCWEMLRDRGYLVPEDQLNLDLETFESEYGQGDIVRDAMTIVCSKVNDPQDQVLSAALSVSLRCLFIFNDAFLKTFPLGKAFFHPSFLERPEKG